MQAEEIQQHNPELAIDKIVKVLHGRALKKAFRLQVARAALPILLDNRQILLDHYRNARTRAIVAAMLSDEGTSRPDKVRNSHDAIFDNWLRKSHPSERIGTGLYQLFRRYKPIRSGNADDDSEWKDDDNHFVICELIYIDIGSLRCSLLTAEGERYSGSVYVSEGNTLYALFQRPVRGKPDAFNHRFLALDLAPNVKHLFSGLMVKIGDTIGKPLAAECLLHHVPTSFRELYDTFLTEIVGSNETEPLAQTSTLFQYMTSPPPTTSFDEEDPQWKRVRRIRDFRILSDLAKRKSEFGKAYLREPSRSLDVGEAIGLAKQRWEVFDQRKHVPVQV